MECQSCSKSDFEAKLEVNGQKIELNKFIEGFISNSVIGMIKSLNGVDEIENINLKICKKQ